MQGPPEFFNVGICRRPGTLLARGAVLPRCDNGERHEVQVPITVTAHRTKNGSKGVIHSTDLEDMGDEKIEVGLAEFGVTAGSRIKSKRRDDTLVPTLNIILTFNQLCQRRWWLVMLE